MDLKQLRIYCFVSESKYIKELQQCKVMFRNVNQKGHEG